MLNNMVSAIGFNLKERLTVYPKFDTPDFLSPKIRAHILKNDLNLYPIDMVKNLETA